MLKNYLILAWKVLSRKKFFTFISLFGISFTLMILTVLAAFLDGELGSHAPITRQNRLVFMDQVVMKLTVPDTVLTIDSTLTGGVMRYDTTMEIGEETRNYSGSAASYGMLDRYLRGLPHTAEQTFYHTQTFDVYLNSTKFPVQTMFADGAYWRVFDFEFIEGGGFPDAAVTERSPVVVISRTARRAFFGGDAPAVGQEVEINRTRFRVVGVVEDVSRSKNYAHADAYIPLTFTREGVLQEAGLQGPFSAAFLAASPQDRQPLKDEIRRKAQTIPIPDPENYNMLELEGKTVFESFATELFQGEETPAAIAWFFGIIGGLVALFILLPTLNLISINVTRILERSSEIGVRKAFGAHPRDLLLQFVLENVLLTLLGGLLGFGLALWLIQVLNSSRALGNIVLAVNYSVFAYGLLITLFFGILSGLLPAWRMSRLHVIQALKQSPV
ncbi:MAG: FtsX-like permease family protein [Bacteroidia bacterium]|nr:FtsX-like permease family protein [Bacteroidia bacterium]